MPLFLDFRIVQSRSLRDAATGRIPIGQDPRKNVGPSKTQR